MEDTHIVQMYWDRNETAISESAMKYGTYCTSIAQNILQNPADAEECVSKNASQKTRRKSDGCSIGRAGRMRFGKR